MNKSKLLLTIFAMSSGVAYAGGTVAPAPAEAQAAPAPAPTVVAPAPAPIVVAPVFVPSWYAGIGIGQSKVRGINASSVSTPTGSLSIDDTDTSWKIFAGYRFHPNFAVELGYVDLGKASFNANVAVGANGVTPGSANGSIKSRAVTLDAVGILPFAHNFEVFGKLGGYYARATSDESAVNFPFIGTASASSSNNNSGFHYGIGLGYSFTRAWAARVEWERFNKVGKGSDFGDSDIDNTSVSIVYKF